MIAFNKKSQEERELETLNLYEEQLKELNELTPEIQSAINAQRADLKQHLTDASSSTSKASKSQ